MFLLLCSTFAIKFYSSNLASTVGFWLPDIWIMEPFEFPTLNSPVFKWWKVHYSNYHLNTGLTMWIPDNFVFKWHSNTRPLSDQTTFEHSNTGQVRYSAPHCIWFLQLNFLFMLALQQGFFQSVTLGNVSKAPAETLARSGTLHGSTWHGSGLILIPLARAGTCLSATCINSEILDSRTVSFLAPKSPGRIRSLFSYAMWKVPSLIRRWKM